MLLLLSLTGCEAEESVDLDPPQGWEGSRHRWWLAGADTAYAFRALETMQEMEAVGSREDVLVVGPGGVVQNQVVQAVKRSLLPLYRNEPTVVDSLFERFVTPELRKDPLQGNAGPYVERYRRRGYDLIHAHFREPLAITRLGEDVPVSYPDSLSERGVGGSVRMQVALSADGEPQAMEILEGVHPVLDAIAMRATTQMRWRPAYVLRNGSWRPISSWVRFSVGFGSPG